MKPEEKFFRLLQKYIPEKSVKYCYDLWYQTPFHFTATKSRTSKYGDYTFIIAKKEHTITVNSDLNKYAFLITYIHEVAHLRNNLKHGPAVKPHGEEWKREFKKLVNPLLNDQIFPQKVLAPLCAYMDSPKASSCTDLNLLKALSLYDLDKKVSYLSDIAIGETFKFNNRFFIKEEVKRSRALCKEVGTKKKYFIPQAAEIDLGSESRLAS